MTQIPSAPNLTHFQVPDLSDTFYCPISCDVMHDPVTIAGDPTGQSYERSEIEHWFRCCLGPKRAPTSNMVFENPTLIPNEALRDEIGRRVRPSAPPLPEDTYASNPLRQRMASPEAGFALPTCRAPNLVDTEPSAPPWSPSAHVRPARSAAENAPIDAQPPTHFVPFAVGASASDFKNVIALGRSRIGREVDGARKLASCVSATVGAVGGLTGAAAAAFGLACGTVVAPCLALAAGVGLLGAGVGLGVVLRRRAAQAARAKPDIAHKLEALHDMRRAFQAQARPTLAEQAILKDLRGAIDLVDGPRADWFKSLKWAGGAALIAIPIGLSIATRLRASKQEGEADGVSATADPLPYQPDAPAHARRENAYEAAARRRAAGAGTGNTYIHNETHCGRRYEASEPFSRLASDLLWRHQFGRTRFVPHRPSQRTWGDGADGEVRVPMKSSWLEALDAHSYARLQGAASVG